MPPFIYRCPNTGYRVQGFIAKEASDHPDTYEPVTCIMCQQVHLVNPTTGAVVGEVVGEDDDSAGGQFPPRCG